MAAACDCGTPWTFPVTFHIRIYLFLFHGRQYLSFIAAMKERVMNLTKMKALLNGQTMLLYGMFIYLLPPQIILSGNADSSGRGIRQKHNACKVKRYAMIRNWYNQIPHPALKTKREITKYIKWQQSTKALAVNRMNSSFPDKQTNTRDAYRPALSRKQHGHNKAT